MNKQFVDDHGYFWWSDARISSQQLAPESSVAGVLRVDGEGKIDLELHGVLPNELGVWGAFANGGVEIPPGRGIHGILKGSNRAVVLSGVRRNGGHLATAGISYEKYIAEDALIGKSVLRPEDRPREFNSLRIDLNGFEDWLLLGAIECERNNIELTAYYRAPEDATYPLDEGSLSIRYDLSGPYPGKSRTDRLTLEESAFIEYVPNAPMSLGDLKEQYAILADLFLVLTGSTYRLELPVVTDATTNQRYQLVFRRQAGTAEKPDRYECWTLFPRIREQFGRSYCAWKKMREDFGPGIGLYVGTERAKDAYVENRFVNLIWGIEALHRKRTSQSASPRPLEEKIRRIASQIDISKIELAKDRKWLEHLLERAAEPRLEERIFNTFSGLSLGISDEDLRSFAAACADRRNQISHYGGRKESGSYREFVIDLAQRANALSYLYQSLLLREIGVDPEIMRDFMVRGFRSLPIKLAFVQTGLLPASVLQESAE
ncbi:MAG: hypothetical protein GJU76_15535 [Gallionella sp.]|jgi:hypothetical protein|nr:hypothetical protein [Gallionella sp.]